MTLWDERCPPGHAVARVVTPPSSRSARASNIDGGCVHSTAEVARGAASCCCRPAVMPPSCTMYGGWSPLRCKCWRAWARDAIAAACLHRAVEAWAQSRVRLVAADGGVGLLAGGGGSGKRRRYRWALRLAADAEAACRRGARTADDEDESLESEQQKQRAAAKARAAAKKQRIVTSGGGQAKQGSTAWVSSFSEVQKGTHGGTNTPVVVST